VEEFGQKEEESRKEKKHLCAKRSFFWLNLHRRLCSLPAERWGGGKRSCRASHYGAIMWMRQWKCIV